MKFYLTFIAAVSFAVSAQAQTITFESLPVPPAGFHNGDPSAGSPYQDNFRSIGQREKDFATEELQLWGLDGVEFFNGYTPDYQSWEGFSWSRVVNTTTQSFSNQYAAAPGGGSNGAGGTSAGENYLIAFGDSRFANESYFNLPAFTQAAAVDITNSTWTALTLANGDAFSKKFGGASGNDADLFSVTFTGFSAVDRAGMQTGSVTFDLADYRFANNAQDYIVSTWRSLDLSALANARSIGLSFFTTDTGANGANTPFYVALDNLRLNAIAVPEPTGVGIGWAMVVALGGRRFRRTVAWSR